MIYIGMDIHKYFIQGVAIDERGRKVEELKFKNELEEIERFVRRFGSKVKVAIEGTFGWQNVYEVLESLKVETKLVNVRRTKVIAESKIKTDKLDALSIAQCLRTGFIAEAYAPKPEIRKIRDIVRHMLSLKREVKRIKNKIHSILLKNGIKHGFTDLFGKAGTEFLKKVKLREQDRYRLDSYLRILNSLNKEVNETAERINKISKADKQAMLLTTIPGISYYSALLIIAEIGDINRFKSEEKLCSYAGLVPRVIQSGNHVYHGKLIKECDQNLKWILAQCAHVHVRCCNSKITKHYRKVGKKRGNNKAIIAAARELLVSIYYMLTRKGPFKING